jgi:hypothetical protein
MKEDVLLHKAIAVLMEKLGPVETSRFLAMDRPRRMESVKRHRQWQRKLDQKEFLDTVFAE